MLRKLNPKKKNKTTPKPDPKPLNGLLVGLFRALSGFLGPVRLSSGYGQFRAVRPSSLAHRCPVGSFTASSQPHRENPNAYNKGKPKFEWPHWELISAFQGIVADVTKCHNIFIGNQDSCPRNHQSCCRILSLSDCDSLPMSSVGCNSWRVRTDVDAKSRAMTGCPDLSHVQTMDKFQHCLNVS